MAIKSGFFPNINGDRPYMSDFIAKMIRSLIGNGVKVNSFKVGPSDGMNISVDAGEGWINGYFILSDAKLIFPVPTASGVLNRIDAVMIRLSYSNREITIEYVPGTPSSIPRAPVPTRTSDVIELKVADIYVGAGAIKIATSQIADTRPNNSVCGFVTGVVDQLSTTELFNRFQALFDDFMGSIQGKLGDDPATSLQNQVNALSDEIAAVEEAANDIRIDFEGFKAAQTPVFGTLTPMSGFRFLTSTNAPVVYRIGRLVHLQFAAQQAGLSNRSIVRLPKGMHDSKNHLIMGMGTETGQLYPLFVGKDVVSFNSNTQTDVYVNASFVLEG